jgi:hypothetical protein
MYSSTYCRLVLGNLCEVCPTVSVWLQYVANAPAGSVDWIISIYFLRTSTTPGLVSGDPGVREVKFTASLLLGRVRPTAHAAVFQMSELLLSRREYGWGYIIYIFCGEACDGDPSVAGTVDMKIIFKRLYLQ